MASKLSIPHKAWIVVGDGEKAMVFRNAGDADYLNLEVLDVMQSDNPLTREQGADQPGRYNDGPSAQRSSVEQTDWHRLGKERFAKDVGALLYKHAHADHYQKLVIVAPPVTLGDLRKELHKEVRDRVIAEIDKTLTNHPVLKIEKLLAA